MPPIIPGTLTADTFRSKEKLWYFSDIKAKKAGPHHTVYWVSGEKYQGDWSDNKKHGKGTIVYKNNDKYEGDWAEDKRHGLGTLWLFKNGKYVVRYNGEWKNDIPNGQGTFFADNGDTYEGNWVNGRRTGKGRAVYGGRPIDGFGGDIYEGYFLDDEKSGPGTMLYASGEVYEGEWLHDLKHGNGTYFYTAKGTRFDGVWIQGNVRAGSYAEIHQPPPGTPGALPPCELVTSDRVLAIARKEASDAAAAIARVS
uniref:MORN repeat-containing protein 3 n=1 Tax=Polytomella parva TaxID=51329 RepID=A0A7S0VCF5_9CHLO|mmetsp:Transcript_32791/g.59425  ORF Transcript_32791/g.59425 Transcript_32791/m.59425 type:complete len:254 (+) Transcript_32791:145-906(+)|eukprot:CAMPEP_0175039334 /NCGR_PEP_ID=MMETSP0052_2-20121109/505_1 /TAXON_ID=51329 ORGANISM="Polytomella parva, Strain SAG 63-3" /NCGR_SAMPLE_ID=MMETSP0052_2 /ASSEMBLY_ACC=CAM_ASM_000194 /LENGTH=253 /DNA_ID=CAMNT_0016301133 /DNA_START=96 /DNA_END=857 /DNA_ORIENTATION=-